MVGSMGIWRLAGAALVLVNATLYVYMCLFPIFPIVVSLGADGNRTLACLS